MYWRSQKSLKLEKYPPPTIRHTRVYCMVIWKLCTSGLTYGFNKFHFNFIFKCYDNIAIIKHRIVHVFISFLNEIGDVTRSITGKIKPFHKCFLRCEAMKIAFIKNESTIHGFSIKPIVSISLS